MVHDDVGTFRNAQILEMFEARIAVLRTVFHLDLGFGFGLLHHQLKTVQLSMSLGEHAGNVESLIVRATVVGIGALKLGQ